jgi:hypothetical protein
MTLGCVRGLAAPTAAVEAQPSTVKPMSVKAGLMSSAVPVYGMAFFSSSSITARQRSLISFEDVDDGSDRLASITLSSCRRPEARSRWSLLRASCSRPR